MSIQIPLFEQLCPLLLRVEGSCVPREGESLEQAFNRCREQAYSNYRADKGGHTFMGITLRTFKAWQELSGYAKEPTPENLKAISYLDWRAIVRFFYFEPILVEKMPFHGVGLMVADYYFHSGNTAIRRLQQLLNDMDKAVPPHCHWQPLKVDGILGRKTLHAFLRQQKLRHHAEALIHNIDADRREFLNGLCDRNFAYEAFRRGWMNRCDITFQTALEADPEDS